MKEHLQIDLIALAQTQYQRTGSGSQCVWYRQWCKEDLHENVDFSHEDHTSALARHGLRSNLYQDLLNAF
jgi:hypothetical protein